MADTGKPAPGRKQAYLQARDLDQHTVSARTSLPRMYRTSSRYGLAICSKKVRPEIISTAFRRDLGRPSAASEYAKREPAQHAVS